jgi:hypothetical protein
MNVSPVFERAFAKLYGKPCWGVTQGYGSSLTLEFGEPHLEIREPIVAGPRATKRVRAILAKRGAVLHGDWHLWIYCCDWEVTHKGKRIGSSASSDAQIQCAAHALNGEKLVRFTLLPRGMQSIFEFDLGGVLKTSPYSKKDEQWLLYEPTGKVLSLRADKRYSHVPRNRPESKTKWRSIQC